MAQHTLPSPSEPRLWIRNPLAAFTANPLDASGGIVVSGGIIAEVLPAGEAAVRTLRRRPSTPPRMSCCRA